MKNVIFALFAFMNVWTSASCKELSDNIFLSKNSLDHLESRFYGVLGERLSVIPVYMWHAYSNKPVSDELLIRIVQDERWYKQARRENSDKIKNSFFAAEFDNGMLAKARELIAAFATKTGEIELIFEVPFEIYHYDIDKQNFQVKPSIKNISCGVSKDEGEKIMCIPFGESHNYSTGRNIAGYMGVLQPEKFNYSNVLALPRITKFEMGLDQAKRAEERLSSVHPVDLIHTLVKSPNTRSVSYVTNPVKVIARVQVYPHPNAVIIENGGFNPSVTRRVIWKAKSVNFIAYSQDLDTNKLRQLALDTMVSRSVSSDEPGNVFEIIEQDKERRRNLLDSYIKSHEVAVFEWRE